MTAEELFCMKAFERKACRVVWRKYRVNKFEVWTLAGFSAFLLLKGKTVMGIKGYVNWLGVGIKEERLIVGNFAGLVKKGLVSKYDRRRGVSFGISGFGVIVLEAFYEEIERLDRSRKKAKIKDTFRDLPGRSIPKDCTLIDPGRAE